MSGKWIEDQDSYYCSNCGNYIDYLTELEIDEYKFCPFCGLEMEGVDEE